MPTFSSFLSEDFNKTFKEENASFIITGSDEHREIWQTRLRDVSWNDNLYIIRIIVISYYGADDL